MRYPWRAHLKWMRPYTLTYPGMLALVGAELTHNGVITARHDRGGTGLPVSCHPRSAARGQLYPFDADP